MKRRFSVGLSYAREDVDYVNEVAKQLAMSLGKDLVFFDKWHEHHFPGPDFDQKEFEIYSKSCGIVVIFASNDYLKKPAPILELVHASTEARKTGKLDLMFFSFGELDEHPYTRYLNQGNCFSRDLTNLSPEHCAKLILDKIDFHRIQVEQRKTRAIRFLILSLLTAILILLLLEIHFFTKNLQLLKNLKGKDKMIVDLNGELQEEREERQKQIKELKVEHSVELGEAKQQITNQKNELKTSREKYHVIVVEIIEIKKRDEIENRRQIASTDSPYIEGGKGNSHSKADRTDDEAYQKLRQFQLDLK